jgi:hypothetical protein
MHFFLTLKHWELFLMLALPTAMTLMFGIPLQPLVVASIGLFMLLVLFAWMFSIGSWANSRLPPARRRTAATATVAVADAHAVPGRHFLRPVVYRPPAQVVAGKRGCRVPDFQQYLFPALHLSTRYLADPAGRQPALP